MIYCAFLSSISSWTSSASGLSELATTTATAASPVMLVTVLHMSKILSGAKIKASPAAGIPSDCNSIVVITAEPPGTAATPIDERATLVAMASCAVIDKSRPKACAINAMVIPW